LAPAPPNPSLAQDAIETFSTAKGEFNKEHLLHAVAAVAGVNLEPQTVDILFHVFDDDCGGTLNHHEFTAVMKLRQSHGASRKRQIDVTQFAKCCNQCWRDNIMFNT
jgi:Ca2+-binding EF-hand superfamily protein